MPVGIACVLVRMRARGRFAAGGIAIRDRPSIVGVAAVFVPATGSLDDAVERDVFDDFELSQLAPGESACALSAPWLRAIVISC